MNRSLLFLTVLVIATCGLVYELIAGTLASYLLGDSVTQFSTVIGVYLSALGLGSYLSRFIERGVAQRFVEIEFAVAFAGGISAPLLFLLFTFTDAFRFSLYSLVLLIGTLVGLEIPLLLRILKDQVRFKDLVSQVLTFDYIGALAASLLFPVLLVPKLGLVRTSLLFGLVNGLVGLWSTWLLRSELGDVKRLRLKGGLVCALLVTGFVMGRSTDGLLRRAGLRGRDRPRAGLSVPADRGDPRAARLLALPERPPPVRQHRRVPLPRVAGAPGDGARRQARSTC